MEKKFLRKFYILIFKILRAITVIGICFIIVFPTIQKLSLAIMVENDVYDPTVMYVPKTFTLINFSKAAEYMKFGEAFINSLFFSTVNALLQTISAIMVGYGLARFPFKGRNILFFIVIMTLIIPPQTLMLPLYLQFKSFDFFGLLTLFGMEGIRLLDSSIPFMILSATSVGLKSGLFIFLTRQQFKGMPKELDEAASIDGAGTFCVFSRIMLPSALPTAVTIFLFSFVWQWNDTFYSSMFLLNKKILSTSLQGLIHTVIAASNDPSGGFSRVMAEQINNAGVILFIVPLIILFLFAQKQFVQSIERSGLVG